jgi:hypothetical protein
MYNDKTALSENSTIGTPLSVDRHSDGIAALDGKWRWEIVAESSGKLFVLVEGAIADCKTLRFIAPLSADDAKKLGIWLTSKIPSMSGRQGA